MEMGEQYGQPDLQPYMTGRTQFPAIPNSPDILHGPLVHYREMFPGGFQPLSGRDSSMASMMMGSQQVSSGGQCGMVFLPQRLDLGSSDSCFISKCGGGGVGGFDEFEEGGDGGNPRWPRRETLALLDIRTKLDSKFKETNQKGPLWDEVSRVLAEEHGYQRSGKKCREKFENLYKYYKKTKEGKAGRQDGKNYRFFNQLEAIYGYTNNPNLESHVTQTQIKKPSFLIDSTSHKPFDSWGFDTGSSSSSTQEHDDEEEEEGKKLRRRRKWKTQLKTYMETQIKTFMERQEAFLEKILQTLETKENERVSREQAWRNQETALLEREHKFWNDERAWIEARDMAILEALKKLAKEETQTRVRVSSPEEENDNGNIGNYNNNSKKWVEPEILSLIKVRTGMERRFFENGCKGNLWEEVSSKMGGLGYERSGIRCKEKWENINKYYWKNKKCNKKRREGSRTCPYFEHLDSWYTDDQCGEVEIGLVGNVGDGVIGEMGL